MTAASDQAVNPGEVKIVNAVIMNAEGKGVNVKNMVASIDIFEDIMSPFITGSVMLNDAIALSEMLPLQGEEYMILELETPGFTEGGGQVFVDHTRAMTVHLYKVEARENTANKNVLYELSFMSLDAMKDMNTKLSRTFRGKPSDIAKRLLEEEEFLGTNKQLLIEPSTNKIAYTSNYWSPSKNLMYIAEQSLADLNNPNYLFFENAEGFVFASLDALYSYDPVTVLVRDNNPRPFDPDKQLDIEEEYSKILAISSKDQYNYIDRCTSGMYGSMIYTFDTETKKLNFKKVDGWRDYGDGKIRLNANLPNKNADAALSGDPRPPPFKPESKMFIEVSQMNTYNGAPLHSLENNMRRATLLNQAMFNKIHIQVFGRFDYTVGRTVDLVIYADKEMLKNDQPEEAYDRILSGRYLIVAVNHSITSKVHYTNMELAKDSYVMVE
jgi:hypothetical protein